MDRNDVRDPAPARPSVALRKESVDRNVPFDVIRPAIDVVALRKESVDRNLVMRMAPILLMTVALRKESVDRNYIIKITEIWGAAVALRKESVDRNKTLKSRRCVKRWSLSARRAWIEMQRSDRFARSSPCRSPQGERG